MKTRFRFTKTGSMKFIGHLDVMRFFQKAIRRAKLDVAYSKGYSPHQLMSFASPLGVGLTSDGEYLDVEFNSLPEHMDKKELLAHLNQAMTDEIFVTDFEIMPDKFKTSMALLSACDYVLSFKDGYEIPVDFAKRFEDYINREQIMIWKKTKRSEKEVDVKPHILQYAFTREDFEQKIGQNLPEFHGEVYENGVTLYLQLTSGSAVNIKPDLIMNDFLTFVGMTPNPYSYQIHRLNMYFDGGNHE